MSYCRKIRFASLHRTLLDGINEYWTFSTYCWTINIELEEQQLKQGEKIKSHTPNITCLKAVLLNTVEYCFLPSSCLTFNFQDLINNSPYYLLWNNYDFNLENLVVDQIVVPWFSFLLNCPRLSAWFCVDIVRRNSVLVAHMSDRVQPLFVDLKFSTFENSVFQFCFWFSLSETWFNCKKVFCRCKWNDRFFMAKVYGILGFLFLISEWLSFCCSIKNCFPKLIEQVTLEKRILCCFRDQAFGFDMTL